MPPGSPFIFNGQSSNLDKASKDLEQLEVPDDVSINASKKGVEVTFSKTVAFTQGSVKLTEKAKIALNEINIGLPLFSSTTNMLKCLVGENNAKKILLGGEMMDSMTATKLGLVDKVVKRELLDETVIDFAKSFSTKKSEVIKSMKDNLKSKSVIGDVDKDEDINNFLDIFYSEETQSILKGIKIRGN